VTVTPRPARHVVRFFLETTGYSGICLPPFGIFILPDRLMQRSLVLHEQCHWHQAERMGLLRWAITYLCTTSATATTTTRLRSKHGSLRETTIVKAPTRAI